MSTFHAPWRGAAGLTACAALLGTASAATATAEPAVVCVADSCTVAASAAYPGRVIGSVERVLAPEEGAALLLHARAAGVWPGLPADTKQFSRLVRCVAVRTRVTSAGEASDFSFLALMTDDEYRDAGIAPGVFVRYAPHGPAHDAPPADQPGLLPYWGVTGCVMALCRPGDGGCAARYLPGIYERATGVALDWRSAKPASTLPVIDPRTLLPLGHAPPDAPAVAAREPSS